MPPTPKQPAPCGTWVSPLTPDAMTKGMVGLGDISVDGDALYWLESRPEEQGGFVAR